MLIVFQKFRQCRVKTRFRPGADIHRGAKTGP
jgi:hypothetical protein